MDKLKIHLKKKKICIPQVVDLFSGCGGLSYGFQLEGFKIHSGVEIDQQACSTASYNLHWKNDEDKEHLNKDITQVNASHLGISGGKRVVTIGGPPCQAYSRIGRPKLRSLGKHRYGLNDDRAFLYREFIRLAVEVNSCAIVMENVPESVNFLGMNIPQNVCEKLEDHGYHAIWTILNSADFGVPQTRERVFVIAQKKKYGEIKYMPVPTHRGNVETYSNVPDLNKFKHIINFRAPLEPTDDLPGWITTAEALSDLPALFPNAVAPYKVNRMNTRMPYQSPPLNDYQKGMRKQSNNRFRDSVDGNCFRRTLRDFRIFERMKPGDDYRHAHKIAIQLFKDACKYHKVSVNDKKAYESLKKEFVPPYDTSKFHSKWKRLDGERPSHTLVAHLGTDTYSHIHPWEPRGISVREAARLQAFPDNFIFNVPMGSAFRQIGNAVPPKLSQAIAKAMINNLQHTCKEFNVL